MSAADHWLWRLSADQWLGAARNEIDQGLAHQASRRAAVVHARRAAGMALNAVLAAMAERNNHTDEIERRWGRSYVEHVRAVAAGRQLGPLAPEAVDDAKKLLAVPVATPSLLPLGSQRGADVRGALQLAGSLLQHATRAVARLREQPV